MVESKVLMTLNFFNIEKKEERRTPPMLPSIIVLYEDNHNTQCLES